MLYLIAVLLLGAVAAFIAGPKFLPVLHRLKFGQTIYELGPESHLKKQGTPIMGGIVFVVCTCVLSLIAVLLWNGFAGGLWNLAFGVLIAALLNMSVGFVDDYIKVVKKRNLGLVWWQKVVGQVVFSFIFATYCYFNPYVGSRIIIPFFNVEWNLGIFYIPLMACVMIFMVNSANLQDGLDGLLSSITVVGSATWGIIALILTVVAGCVIPDQYRSLAVVAFALCGSLIGFLRINYYPAKTFMGDTGSMFIGGAIVGMSMLMRMPILMLFTCITWLASSFSVIIQRTYFKLTHGKRIFKMSPIHHHFELSGMTETQIIMMYDMVEILACLIALFSLNLVG